MILFILPKMSFRNELWLAHLDTSKIIKLNVSRCSMEKLHPSINNSPRSTPRRLCCEPCWILRPSRPPPLSSPCPTHRPHLPASNKTPIHIPLTTPLLTRPLLFSTPATSRQSSTPAITGTNCRQTTSTAASYCQTSLNCASRSQCCSPTPTSRHTNSSTLTRAAAFLI